MAANKVYTLIPTSALSSTGVGGNILLSPYDNRWIAYLSVGNVTGTTPSLTVTVQQSCDGVNWLPLIAFTAVTASGSVPQQLFTPSSADYSKPLMPLVRASYAITGTTPNFANVLCQLFCAN